MTTPLLDLFRRGEVPPDIRMLAARGALAPRASEQLALLVLLSGDEDRDIAETARLTIDRIPRTPLASFLARADVPDETVRFFRAIGVEPAAAPSNDEDEQPLITADDVTAAGAEEEGDEDLADEEKRQATAQRLAQLPVAERMKRALLGTREERFILIRDTNRLIAACVLSSPKLTVADVEMFARMANVAEDVLRTIGKSRAWVKRYPIAAALALNAKTPVAVSLPLVPRLVERDIKVIVRDRNMPEPVRAAARRVLSNNETRRS